MTPGSSLPTASLKSPRPLDAATLILVRGAKTRRPAVLMGRRSTRDAWADLYIFPGGRVDRTDYRVPTSSELRSEVSARLQLGCTAARTRALGVAAIRELSEETGLILGREPVDARPTLPQFAEAGLAPDLGALHLLCRAVTPPKRPKRFNARFFVAEESDVIGDLGGTGELVDLRWWTLPQARKLELPKITQAVLAELEALLERGQGLHTPEKTALFKTVGRNHRRLFESE